MILDFQSPTSFIFLIKNILNKEDCMLFSDIRQMLLWNFKQKDTVDFIDLLDGVGALAEKYGEDARVKITITHDSEKWLLLDNQELDVTPVFEDMTRYPIDYTRRPIW